MADESDIIQALRDDPTVNGIVSGRIYSELRTERDPMPAVTVELLAGVPTNYLDGEPGMDRRVMAVACYDKTRRGSRALGYAVRAVLEPRGYLLNEGPIGYDETLKSWETLLEFSFWQRR